MRISPTGKGGFTIVELIVVVILIGVLAGMIAPRLAATTGSARLRSTARRLQATAQYARDYAATHRRACRLVIDTDEGRWRLAVQEDPEHRPGEFVPLASALGRSDGPGEDLALRVRIEHRPRRDGTRAADNCIDFDPAGRADAAVVEITNGRMTYSVLIVPDTGRVRLIEGTRARLPNEREDLDA